MRFVLWDEVDRPEVLELFVHDPAIDDVRYTPGAVLRRVNFDKASKSKLTRIINTPIYQLMTIRNCNTARKLVELLGE